MSSCIFCNLDLIKEDILFETKNFYVKVPFGLITAGHVMILTKKHMKCSAELSDEVWDEYQVLKDKLIDILSEIFSKPIFFEHGGWEQSVKHAHIHVIPSIGVEYEVKDIIKEMIVPYSLNGKVVDFDGLKRLYYEWGGYLLIEQNGVMTIFDGLHMNEVDSYHLHYRFFFSDVIGLSGVKSWQDVSDVEKKRDEEKRKETKEKLKGLL